MRFPIASNLVSPLCIHEAMPTLTKMLTKSCVSYMTIPLEWMESRNYYNGGFELTLQTSFRSVHSPKVDLRLGRVAAQGSAAATGADGSRHGAAAVRTVLGGAATAADHEGV